MVSNRPRDHRAVAVARREGFPEMIHVQAKPLLETKEPLRCTLDPGYLDLWGSDVEIMRKTPPGDSRSLGMAKGSGYPLGSEWSFL